MEAAQHTAVSSEAVPPSALSTGGNPVHDPTDPLDELLARLNAPPDAVIARLRRAQQARSAEVARLQYTQEARNAATAQMRRKVENCHLARS